MKWSAGGCNCCGTPTCTARTETFDDFITTTEVKTFVRTTLDGTPSDTQHTDLRIMHRDETVDSVVTLVESIGVILCNVKGWPYGSGECSATGFWFETLFNSPLEAWNQFGGGDRVKFSGYALGQSSMPADYDAAAALLATATWSHYHSTDINGGQGNEPVSPTDPSDEPDTGQDYLMVFFTRDDAAPSSESIAMEFVCDRHTPKYSVDFWFANKTFYPPANNYGITVSGDSDRYPYYIGNGETFTLAENATTDCEVSITPTENGRQYGSNYPTLNIGGLSMKVSSERYDSRSVFIEGFAGIPDRYDRHWYEARYVEVGATKYYFDRSLEQILQGGESIGQLDTRGCLGLFLQDFRVNRVRTSGFGGIVPEKSIIKVLDTGASQNVDVKLYWEGNLPSDPHNTTVFVTDEDGSRNENVSFTAANRSDTVTVRVETGGAFVGGSDIDLVAVDQTTTSDILMAGTQYYGLSGTVDVQCWRNSSGLPADYTIRSAGSTTSGTMGAGTHIASVAVAIPPDGETTAPELPNTVLALGNKIDLVFRDGTVEVVGDDAFVQHADGDAFDCRFYGSIPLASGVTNSSIGVAYTGESTKFSDWSVSEFISVNDCDGTTNNPDCPNGPKLCDIVWPHSFQQFEAIPEITGKDLGAKQWSTYQGCVSEHQWYYSAVENHAQGYVCEVYTYTEPKVELGSEIEYTVDNILDMSVSAPDGFRVYADGPSNLGFGGLYTHSLGVPEFLAKQVALFTDTALPSLQDQLDFSDLLDQGGEYWMQVGSTYYKMEYGDTEFQEVTDGSVFVPAGLDYYIQPSLKLYGTDNCGASTLNFNATVTWEPSYHPCWNKDGGPTNVMFDSSTSSYTGTLPQGVPPGGLYPKDPVLLSDISLTVSAQSNWTYTI